VKITKKQPREQEESGFVAKRKEGCEESQTSNQRLS